MRYFIQFSYFGQAYHGWQNQPNAITVQQTLEHAMAKLLRSAVSLAGAGRTDAGVHAKQLYAHFDLEKRIAEDNFVFRLNAFLPDDIAVQDIFEVRDDAHARFDATARTYEYWVVQEKNPFLNDAAHYVKHPLDFDKMNLAAKLFLSHSDFECFSKSNTEVKTYLCDVQEASWQQRDDHWIFTITADRFLRNMVRAIVGTLLEVGQNKISIDHVKTILKSKDRTQAGPSVPAKGLYLTQVTYPESIFIKHG
ncbi:MAG: tRNA pseudouridine(38-40) synthase TruA [Flavobacteriaceae bacterium]